ncbi:hypothetical protein FZCC0069_01255 [Rhodobacterales bacterium FZCC0069]|nr:hypothetical protein [Rhodobacterales bacterium FZCC0069]
MNTSSLNNSSQMSATHSTTQNESLKDKRARLISELKNRTLCESCRKELFVLLNEVDQSDFMDTDFSEPEQLQFAFMQDDPNDKN